ncbi:MAG: FmdE family protein [Chloroflexota bacterium]
MSELADFLAQSVVLHHHLCPRQVLGVRMGMVAALLLDLELPQGDKRLYTFVETDGCFADGVMVATGCSLGHRTLRLIDYGKVAATFVDTLSERAVRIVPHRLARTRAIEYEPNIESHWRAQLEAYQIMPLTELFQATEVTLNLSLKAVISQAGLRVTCSVCGEEILNAREIRVGDQIVCQSCGEESYWSAARDIANSISVGRSAGGLT